MCKMLGSFSTVLTNRSWLILTVLGILIENVSSQGHMSCTFEHGQCHWFGDDDSKLLLDWVRRTGSTTSNKIGPKKDADGHPTGYYMSLESKTTTSATGRFISPPALTPFMTENVCIILHYYMYGTDVQTLRIKLDKKTVWETSGDQGDVWHKVDIPASDQHIFQVVIEGTFRGPNASIAVDNLDVFAGHCPQGFPLGAGRRLLIYGVAIGSSFALLGFLATIKCYTKRKNSTGSGTEQHLRGVISGQPYARLQI